MSSQQSYAALVLSYAYQLLLSNCYALSGAGAAGAVYADSSVQPLPVSAPAAPGTRPPRGPEARLGGRSPAQPGRFSESCLRRPPAAGHAGRQAGPKRTRCIGGPCS